MMPQKTLGFDVPGGPGRRGAAGVGGLDFVQRKVRPGNDRTGRVNLQGSPYSLADFDYAPQMVRLGGLHHLADEVFGLVAVSTNWE